MRLKNKLAIAMLLTIVLLSLGLAIGAPAGAIVNKLSADSMPVRPLGTISALGGKHTPLNLSGETQTLVWQGIFGDISGNVTLSDAANHTLYSWQALNLSNAKIFASRSSTVSWQSITAQNNCSVDQDLTGLFSDRVNATFTPSANAEILVGDISISANSTCAAWTYINSSAQTDKFQELILTDGVSTIYATAIEQNATGFDSSKHDFQMLLPETQNSSTSTYYFYVEYS
ncbi:hypothetical protein DRJ25_02055 [Candidatus Woesearchaeota archaeon]|nr:MAG: hypothetical protein DRJ25_02055 [Candidatus Woesearchaeota archaeon]